MSRHERKKIASPRELCRKAISGVGGRRFFYLILIIFALQALWIAFSFRYPMLYDEGYHFNLIKLFAHGYSPILNNQPTWLDTYGVVVHHGSTLFHYLMSFPYRIFADITGSMTWQVIFLRMIDILFFGIGIWLFDKTFKKIGLKQIHSNLAILLFVLLPIVPFVAATINYDNLLFLFSALFLYLGVLITQIKKPDWQLYLGFLLTGAVALLVKLEFGPIFAAAVIYLLIDQLIKYKWRFITSVTNYFERGIKAGALIILATLITLTLLGQYYVSNYADYHALLPSCQRLLGAERCSKSYVVQHDLSLQATKNQRPALPFPKAAKGWLYEMEHFMGLTGANLPGKAAIFAPPLSIAYSTWFVVTAVGFFVTLLMWFRWRHLKGATFLFAIFIIYTLAVFGFNIHSYYQDHAFTAVQPRYLLQTLLILLVLIVYSFDKLLDKVSLLKPVLVIGVFVLMLDGGGIVSPIYRSDDNWYWQNHTIIRVNNKLKRTIDPLVVR